VNRNININTGDINIGNRNLEMRRNQNNLYNRDTNRQRQAPRRKGPAKKQPNLSRDLPNNVVADRQGNAQRDRVQKLERQQNTRQRGNDRAQKSRSGSGRRSRGGKRR